ncbi:DMT family transporter [Devosia neptuniae]|jgi:drug/metabolite transporter (DMT)-like permease|uniref:DMT family transporter n=1 Tax=Devosia TaxID=46913 RepID=UPI0022AFDAC1|nr:DMT family transporter [Devosia neptuniae]MCZ4345093.1 DMT family transporter [Devosia neptuniae]|tara:strand:+ start:57021 stop:57911 length:891 start_codon:yes stop_codon:yes gene_type:complete
MERRDWFLIIMLGAIWGCSFIFNAVLIREIGPIWVTSFRVGIGAIGCWVFLLLRRKPIPRDPMLWIKLGGLGILAYAIPFALFPLAQANLASGVAAIINALTPLVTVIVSHFWLGGEKASRIKMAGVTVGFAGAFILAWPALSTGGDSRLWAIGACLLATLCYALSLNITRSFKAIEPTALASIALTGAAAVSIPVAFLTEGTPVMVRPETWLAAIAIGLMSTAFTFQVMYRILPRVGPTNFATTTFIAPISAVILGVTVLRETVLPIQILGMFVIFTGLLLIDGRIGKLWRRVAT